MTPIYQKTFGINDFYLDDGAGGPPLGNIQLLGRVTGQILKANLRLMPEFALNWLSRHAVDFYAMSEDLPNPDSRVTLDGAGIRLDWKRSNWASHLALVAKLRERLRAAGYPIVLARAFDRRTPSHQCGTVRIGLDPSDGAARSLLPCPRPSKSFRGRRLVPADIGGGQPGADHRGAGASRRKPHCRQRSLTGGSNGLRLYHRRRRLRRLRARQSAERGSDRSRSCSSRQVVPTQTCCFACRPVSPR